MAGQQLVYHYCTVEALMNILKNRSIRLSDMEKSNDYAERRWMQEMIAEEFCHLMPDAYEKQREFRACFQSFTEQKNLYAACFSEKPDLLSQWRAYAMDGRGVAIGFEKTAFNEAANPAVRFLKICYDQEKERVYARTQAEEIYRLLGNGLSMKEVVCAVYGKTEVELSVMKNPAFEEEQEWRICLAAAPEACTVPSHIKEGFCLSPVRIYYSNYRLISYIELEFSKKKDRMVKEIILGPKCRLEKRDVQMCLGLWGYEKERVQILQSSATYS
ncbi:DUF2971 domain-containing protein [Novisyntrophococcus fermenticellae]|uniref:DUF2971 domain-containing protein n=1 Tax=Novisyntrophococcus fermenticellae TaxID=2068655 RepID=UPI001E5E56F5|nr:DUF2971 domain-containing protein [Novisyntrophococcus fermenticellae]